MSGGGFRPASRYVVLRAGSAVIDTASEWDPDKRIGYQVVTLALPNGVGTIELRVETKVAGAVANALAGLELAEDAPPDDDVVCHVCGSRDWPHYDGLAGGRWVCSGRPGCDPGVLWPADDLSPAQLDGTACVRCGELLPAVSAPAGRATGFGQVFACAPSCPPAGGVR
ncbi:hypothetical protein [Embleya sp. NPDC001921]